MNGRRAFNASQAPSNEVTLAKIKYNINFLVIRIDEVFLTQKSSLISDLISKGELFGFKIVYKFPHASPANTSLNREVVANSSRFSSSDVTFRHKKVFAIELKNELIEKWDSSSLHISFSMNCARGSTKEHSFLKTLSRGNISLAELLSPPFMIQRDVDLVGSDVTASLSISIELGSRQQRTSEMLSDLRKSALNSTFKVEHSHGFGGRSRSRSSSRCRSCSTGENSPRASSPILPARQISPRKTLNSDRQPLRPVIPPLASHRTSYNPVILPPDSSANRVLQHSDDNDSVFEAAHPQDREIYSRTGSLSDRRGAVNLRLTLHRANNLPLVKDERGNFVPPCALVSILARDGTVMSSIAPANRSPCWDWSGDFVFSLERGNLLIKLLHSSESGRLEPLGLVMLSTPLRSFDYREYEVQNATGYSSNVNATVTISLDVMKRPPSAAGSLGSYDRISADRSRVGSSNSARSADDNGSLFRWTGTATSPHLELRTRRARSLSRNSPVETPILRTDTSHQLENNLRELDRIMRRMY